MAAGRRRAVARELGNRVRWVRRAFLLLPGQGERPVYDAYVISHRRAAAAEAPDLPFAIPEPGHPYPRSSLPPQLVALRVQDRQPERLEALEDALFAAVFVTLEDVADPAVLTRCAETAGLADPAEEVRHALADRDLRLRAAREHMEAASAGIRGIPALLAPGAPPIVGAVPLETYRAALGRALAATRP